MYSSENKLLLLESSLWAPNSSENKLLLLESFSNSQQFSLYFNINQHDFKLDTKLVIIISAPRLERDKKPLDTKQPDNKSAATCNTSALNLQSAVYVSYNTDKDCMPTDCLSLCVNNQ